ncbi:MAG: DinB family protein [Candidatus Hodarchaeales archaeon]
MLELIKVLENRRLGTLFILKMIPQNLWDWKPADDMKSMGDLANHLARDPIAMLAMFRGEITEETYQSAEKGLTLTDAPSLVKTYEKGLKELISYLEENIENAREKNLKLFYRESPTSLYSEVFEMIGHQWFHLGQLFTYLRINGVKVNMGAYYGYQDPDPDIPPNK